MSLLPEKETFQMFFNKFNRKWNPFIFETSTSFVNQWLGYLFIKSIVANCSLDYSITKFCTMDKSWFLVVYQMENTIWWKFVFVWFDFIQKFCTVKMYIKHPLCHRLFPSDTSCTFVCCVNKWFYSYFFKNLIHDYIMLFKCANQMFV